MSGMADESVGHYARGARNLINDWMGTDPNQPSKPSAPDNEQATLDRLNDQRMSGMNDESLSHYIRGGKELIKEAINPRYNRDVNSVDPESVYSPEVRKDRSRVVSSPFNADSADYDYLSAESAGYKPSQEEGPNKGHMGSVRKSTPEEIKKYGIPQDSYLLLKGAKHPTHKMAVDAEAQRGFEIVKYGDRYFSVPKQKPVSSWDAINQGL